MERGVTREGEDHSRCEVSRDRATWDQVAAYLDDLSEEACEEGEFKVCVRDPLRTDILEDWWERETTGN
jgi:hypothetical protein